jgi:uncharacterized protein (TIGR03437 family)
LAQVYADGVLQGMIDTYLTPSKPQTAAYSLTGLAPGMHVLSIVATGTHGPASAGSWIWVDAFQVGTGSNVITPSSPAINAGGVVSAASFSTAPNNQVAPGQLVAIFGQNFLAGGSVNAGATPLPTQLGPQGTSVTACGRAIPLYNLFPGQINAQIPLECPTSGVVTATVSVGGLTGTQTFTLAPASPGIFTVDGSGAGTGVIVHANTSLVSSTNPAKAGEEVVIYATGLGATNPAFPTGSAANLINTTVLPVTVTIGGKDAAVAYNGLTQGFVGLYQINVIVPSGLTGTQPVVVTVGSTYASRAGVTMAVQ